MLRSELPEDIHHYHSITSGVRNEMTTNTETMWAREQTSLERYIMILQAGICSFLVMILCQSRAARKVLLKARSSEPSPEEKL